MRKNLAAKIGLVCIALYCAVISFAEGSMQSTVWKNVSSGIKDSEVKTITVSSDNPEIAYAGTRSVVYQTMDGGKIWDEVLSFRGTENIILTIKASPLNKDTIYAGTKNGLYASNDSGQNWTRIYQSIRKPESYVLSVAVSPTDPSNIFIGTGQGVYRTDNGGKDWKRDRGIPGTIVSDIIIDQFNPLKMYASTSNGLHKSIDSGANWKRLYISSLGKHEREVRNKEDEDDSEDNKWNEHEDEKDEILAESQSRNIAVDPVNSSTVYFRSPSGIYVSHDSGSSWDSLSSTGLSSQDVRHILVRGTAKNKLFTATGRGVFRYSPEKQSWESLYKGLTTTDIHYITSNPASSDNNASLWAATTQGVFKTEAVTLKTNPKFEEMSAQDILNMFEHEPTMEEIRESAIEYASVHPDKIEKWRKAAAKKAWLPNLSMKYGKGEDWQNSYSFYKVDGEYEQFDDITDGNDESWSVSVSWELSNLIWTTSQSTIELRSKAMVQLRDDVLNEVTRLYFERRRLQTEIIMAPPESLTERIEKELRLQELTAGIDAFTGSYLSKRLALAANIQQ